MEDAKRYSVVVVGIAALGALAVGGVNLLVDPYDVHDVLRLEGVNANKPEQRFHDRLHKAHAVYRELPDVVLLGTSRTQVGLDPEAPALVERGGRALNLALSGGTPYEARRYLQHAQAVRSLGLAILGLDFLSFDARQDFRNPEFDEARLSVSEAFVAQPLARGADLAATLLSWTALGASARTLLAQRQPSYFHSSGQRTSRFMEARLVEAGGMRANMLASERQYLDDFACYQALIPDGASPGVGELAKLAQFARDQGIVLRLFISPSHARDLLVIRAAGLWPDYERWKRAVVAAAGPGAWVWDFSGANRYTAEAVPPLADAEARMRWYWESSHYRSELGDLVLERVLGAPEREATRGFGVALTRDNVDIELGRVAAELDTYARTNPDQVLEIERARDAVLPVAREVRGCAPKQRLQEMRLQEMVLR